MGIRQNIAPLAREKILQEPIIGDILRIPVSCLGERFFTAHPEGHLPLRPGSSAVGILQSHKQGVIFQPAGFFFYKSLIVFAAGKAAP